MSKSPFSILGLSHRLFLAAEAQGHTMETLNSLAEHPTLFSEILSVQQGNAKIVPNPLLSLVRTVDLSAVEHFDGSVAFGPESGIKFYFGDNFKKYILPKIEQNVPARTLAIHKLERRTLDAPIRTELTPAREETALAHLHQLIKAQANGEEGPLPIDGSWIIAYVIGTDNSVWAVGASWRATYRRWCVDAYSVTHPFGWPAGLRVLSGK